MTPVRKLGIAMLVTAAVLAACGDDGEDTGADATTSSSTTSTVATSEAPTTTAGTTESAPATTDDAPSGSGGIEVPPPDECVTVAENPDNTYRINGVGTVRLQRSGATLDLVEATAEGGWQVTGDEADDPDEVEVEFRRDGTELEFEAEIEDDRLEIDLCSDD